jgi:hypothetical protein
MTEKSGPPKNEEERRKEAEKLKAEAERSLEVIRTKYLHGLIESVEKSRKLSSLISLWERINFNMTHLGKFGELLMSPERTSSNLSFEEIELVQWFIKTHESIRKDFRELTEMDDKKLEELFPSITTYFETPAQATLIITKIIEQEAQIKRYSYRMSA